jgi:hypothetical protein
MYEICRRRWLTICFLLAATSWATAQSNPDLSSPKKATIAFAMGLQSGNLDQVKASSIGDESDYKLMQTVTSTMSSVHKLEDAAVARFGREEGKKLGAGVNDNSDIARQVEESDEKVDGDSATILEKGKPDTNAVHLKKVDGGWKVDLTNYPQKRLMQQNAPMLDAMRTVMTQSAVDVSSGRYRTVDDAQVELRQRLAAVMAAVAKQTIPQTNPGK